MLNEENIALYAFRKYSDTALRAAFCLTGVREDAEDIAQEVFLALHEKPRSFRDDEHLKAWLLRAVINRCRNLHKSWWRSRRTDAENVPEDVFAVRDDSEREILRQITELGKPYSSVVYLHDYEGYTIEETAKILRKNKNTVASALRRAHLRLRMELEE